MGRFDWRTLAVVVVVAVGVVVAMLVVVDDDRPRDRVGPGPTTSVASPMSRLVFAVWGGEEEVAAYQSIVDDWNATSEVVDVRVESWPDASSMLGDIRSGAVTPDLYLLPRGDLAETIAADRNRPLLDLLDARGVIFGDDYSRDSVAAFSAEDDLQCMPYGTSPMVVYYNTELVDLARMERRDLPVPNEERDGWTFEAFRAAAEYASRPQTGTRGVHVEPTLEGLAPFVYSGGGDLYDDEDDPTSLTLGEDDSVEAMRQTLELLRDPKLTLSDDQLERRSAVEWFQAGELGMIAGYRDLTPLLRGTPGLQFDVLPMPVIGGADTVGELTGVCVADGDQARVEQAADFLVHLVSDASVAEVTETGYLMPTNLEVSFSDSFLQPGREPANAAAFNVASRSIVLEPLLVEEELLDAAVGPALRALLTDPVLEDLEASLAEIDELSRTVLTENEPEETEEPAPSEDPSSDPSPDQPSR